MEVYHSHTYSMPHFKAENVHKRKNSQRTNPLLPRPSFQGNHNINYDTYTIRIPNYAFGQPKLLLGTGGHMAIAHGTRTSDQLSVFVKLSPYALRLEREYYMARRLYRLPDGPHCLSNVIEMVSLAHDGLAALIYTAETPALELPATFEDIESFMKFAIDASRSLHFLHANNIIHGELRPSSFQVNKDTTRIWNFGSGLRSYEDILLTGLGSKRSVAGPNGPNTIKLHNQPEDPIERPFARLAASKSVQHTLVYLSPEQTGRTSTVVDHRTDLYSLGIVFFVILTGQMPFEGSAVDILQAVLSRSVPPPHTIRVGVPPVMSLIIDKLTRKAVDERYNSAYGLLEDLVECQRRMQCPDPAESLVFFPLGLHDIYSIFQFPSHLFGRDHEIESVRLITRRVSCTHALEMEKRSTETAPEDVLHIAQKALRDPKTATEVIVVMGPGGAGKSVLVTMMHTQARQHGYLASSKFDSNQKRPYNGLLRCLSSILRQLLTEPESVIRDFYTDLKEELGPQFCNVWLMVDRVPELKPIFNGEEPDMPQDDMLGGNSESRFHAVFLSIIRTIAATKMITLCLDDLHEADEPSLHLISTLIASRITLLIILTCRDNHDLPQSVLNIIQCTSDEAQRIRINLGPLTKNAVTQLVSQTLHRASQDVQQLAELIFRRTRGNPFFARQFMMMMKRREDIWFNWDAKEWQFRLDHAAQNLYPQVQLQEQQDEESSKGAKEVCHLVSHLRDMDPHAQQFMMWASLLGNVFDFRQVQWLMRTVDLSGEDTDQVVVPEPSSSTSLEGEMQFLFVDPAVDLHQDDPRGGQAMTGLQVALQENVIISKIGSEFQFVHDRYYQAAAMLVNPAHVEHMHLRISQMLLVDQTADIFLTADHVVKSMALVKLLPDRSKYRQILMKAGDEGYRSGALQMSSIYYNTTLELLSDTPWKQEGPDATYDETLSLYMKLTEMSWRDSKRDKASLLLQKIMHETENRPIDGAYALRFQARMYFEQQRHHDGLSTILKALEALGITYITLDLSESQVLELYTQVRESIEELGDSIVLIGPCTDPLMLAAMTLLYEACTGAYWISPLLVDFMTLCLVRISLKHGFGVASGGGLIGVGCTAARLMQVQFGAHLGQLGMAISEKYAGNSEIARGIITYHVILAQWTTGCHYRDLIFQFQRAYKFAIAGGDKMHSAMALFHASSTLLYTSFNLSEINFHINRSIEECLDDSSQDAYTLNISLWRVILAFQGNTTVSVPGHQLDDLPEKKNGFREEDFIANVYRKSVNPGSPMNWHWSFKIIVLYHFGHFQEAADIGFKILETSLNHPSHRHIGIALYYHSLAMVACIRENSIECSVRKMYFEQVARNQAILSSWADHSEVNYRMYYKVVEAERSTLDNDMERTCTLFNAVIEVGLKGQWYSFLGLTYQLLAEYYIRSKINMLALPMLNQSIEFYECWGAYGKMQYMSERYGHIIQSNKIMTRKVDTSTQTEEQEMANGFWQDDDSSPEPSFRELYGDESIPGLLDTETALFSLDIMDLTSIIKSSQVISNEMNSFDELLKRMMGIIMTNASANVGAIIIKEGEFGIAAYSTKDEGCQTCDPPMRLDDGTNLISTLVVHYVIHTQTLLFIPNMQDDTRFATGTWLIRGEAVSVICLPIMHKNILVGVLYLEANLSTFTRKHVTVLSLLCDQIGISITNALLFKSLQKATTANSIMITKQQCALEEARKSKEQALKATELKSNFLANMSHELRTPFSGFYGMISLLSETRLDAEQREFVSIAKQSCEMLLQIIDDLLDFSKLEARKVKIQYGLFYIEDLIADRIELLINLASKKNLELTYFINQYVPPIVYADGHRIGQVLMNLIGNAIKFTHVGEVTVRCEIDHDTDELAIPLKEDEMMLRFSVQDTGIGMTKEETKCLFLPFSQVDGSTTRNFGGTGLGLSICLELVSLMGGNIWVESHGTSGSTFVFRVRVMKVSSVSEPGIGIDPRNNEALEYTKKLGEPHILLATSGKVSEMIKTIVPFELDTIESPEKVIDICKSNIGPEETGVSNMYDCIILDMPPIETVQTLLDTIESTQALKNSHIVILYAPTVDNIKRQIVPASNSVSMRPDAVNPMFHPRVTRVSKPIRKIKLLSALFQSIKSSIPSPKNPCQEICSNSAICSEASEPVQHIEPPFSYGHKHREGFAPEELAVFQQQKILVAEDNPVAQKLIVKQLTRLGFTVETCNNGFECIEAWKNRGPGYFSLAWIDHHMPGCDGLEATVKIRALEAEMKAPSPLPIIALTADIQKTAQQNCLDAGMNDYITKPLMQKDLAAVLRRYCFHPNSGSTSTSSLS
ncbi:hypothetical protein CLU79DRAFT_734877 [Phycomyces nitens]|nr:hypothetical protein CLU79DRAFT_734877 [Phycomyces nitens]